MKRLLVVLVGATLLLSAKPQAMAAWYDLGITPSKQTGWVEIGGTSSNDACAPHTEGCEPCFTEDNQWKRGWYGDLDGMFVVGQTSGVDLNFCPWGSTASLFFRARLPRRSEATLTAMGPDNTIVAEDRGIVDGKHEYLGCAFYGSGLTGGRHYVSLATKSRDVALETHVLVEEAARQWCAPVIAARASRADFTWETTLTHQNPVEEQTPGFGEDPPPDPSVWVVNRTGCAWDVDDSQSLAGHGSLAPGASVASPPLCIIGDTSTPHLLGVRVCPTHDRQPLDVRLVFDLRATQRGIVNVPVSTASGCARLCAAAGIFTDPYLQPIDGSNGGVGLRFPYWIEIANPSRNRSVSVTVEHHLLLNTGNSQDVYCPGGRWLHERGTCLPYIPGEPGVCWLP